ncbi:hypothetical protein AB3S75_039296 [Citrus x aurantiifolia]
MEPRKKLFQMLLLLSAAFFIGSSNRCVHGSDSDGFSELFIDCGASGETTISFNGVDTHWHEDKDFINTGKNLILTPSEVFDPMNSLRFFPNDNKSCYNLPLQPFNGKFLFRAGFFYGNYDGLYRPSSFKLEIDGNLWANVTTSYFYDPRPAMYHELIYRTTSERTTVCLVRNSDNGVAFISTLQSHIHAWRHLHIDAEQNCFVPPKQDQLWRKQNC